MSLLKGVIIDIESTATKAVNAAAVQTELSQIIEDIADCIDNAFTCTDLDSTYESDQVEKLINALTTSTKAAKMNAQVVLQLTQAALSSASDAVYTEDDQKTLSESAAAGLTEKEAKDELDFCNDGSNPRHCIECGKCVLFHNNIICQSCQNIIKKNKEKPKDESKRCTECGRWLIRFMSCQECKLIMDEQDGIWSCSECDAQVCYDDGSDYADCGHLAFSEHHLENMCNCELDK